MTIKFTVTRGNHTGYFKMWRKSQVDIEKLISQLESIARKRNITLTWERTR